MRESMGRTLCRGVEGGEAVSSLAIASAVCREEHLRVDTSIEAQLQDLPTIQEYLLGILRANGAGAPGPDELSNWLLKLQP